MIDIQSIVKAFCAISRLATLLPLSEVIAAYFIFDQKVVQFGLLSLRMSIFAPIEHSHSLEGTSGPLLFLDRVDQEAYGRTSGQHLVPVYHIRPFSMFCLMPLETKNCMN